MTLARFSQLNFSEYLKRDTLDTLDQHFLSLLASQQKNLHRDLLRYRENPKTFSSLQISELIIHAARELENFIAEFFDIESATAAQQTFIEKDKAIFAFKKWIVLRRAKRRLTREETLEPFESLNAWLNNQLDESGDKELAVSELAVRYLDDKEAYEAKLEKLTQWAIHCLKDHSKHVSGWVSFKLPKRTDYRRLIPIITEHGAQQLPAEQWRSRDGFDLTDSGMNERQVQAEIDYCVLCHDHDGDFCSKGFPEKKGEPELGFRKNPLDNTLTGCPLDEKISEMNTLQKEGLSIAALATIMIDNPMCPATGHRICNDCMKACIYQKQDPVDVPQIETRILKDVLSLPYGVEIYDLLTRWNPLRSEQFVEKPYNGKKVFIAGMGPAGFSLAYHLLMEGCAVVGSDGLKIEDLPQTYLNTAIEHYSDITEPLSTRQVLGFGGVAEYGITVRWDKNFLKLIYISLSRRKHFQLFDGVRFGGTVTIESLYAMGFDHVSIAVGAGLPKALPIPGSMAPGMRQANDFLMALQLTGAAKKDSLANVQLRLPAVIIGGGLTGVDAATEAQAYYIKQVEKTLARYEALCKSQSEASIRNEFDKASLAILDEFLNHGEQVRNERKIAQQEDRAPNFLPLIHAWGGVTIAYRRHIHESPAYISNHEELHKALEEGLFYRDCVSPVEVTLDAFGHSETLIMQTRRCDEDGHWHDTDEYITLPAKTILVATGASPNVAYDFEHQNLLKRTKMQYDTYDLDETGLNPTASGEHVKSKDFGPFTSYADNNHFVSFLGDVHPTFHGNVVRAIASAKRSHPKIMRALALSSPNASDHQSFADDIHARLDAKLLNKRLLSESAWELTFHAPEAAKRFKPGQFYRLQNYETHARTKHNTRLQMEPLALLASRADSDQGTVTTLLINRGVSSAIAQTMEAGEPASLMGPTGVRSKIPNTPQNILIIANEIGLAYALALTPALRDANCPVTLLAYAENKKDFFYQDELNKLCDNTHWITDSPEKYLMTHPEIIKGQDRITLFGDACLLKNIQALRSGTLAHLFKPEARVYGSVHSTMQCMLKGVCAQCLQWQIDPATGKRTKAVFACSWQDQPLEMIDFDNYAERSLQNKMSETLSRLWYEHINKEVTHG